MFKSISIRLPHPLNTNFDSTLTPRCSLPQTYDFAGIRSQLADPRESASHPSLLLAGRPQVIMVAERKRAKKEQNYSWAIAVFFCHVLRILTSELDAPLK